MSEQESISSEGNQPSVTAEVLPITPQTPGLDGASQAGVPELPEDIVQPEPQTPMDGPADTLPFPDASDQPSEIPTDPPLPLVPAAPEISERIDQPEPQDSLDSTEGHSEPETWPQRTPQADQPYQMPPTEIPPRQETQSIQELYTNEEGRLLFAPFMLTIFTVNKLLALENADKVALGERLGTGGKTAEDKVAKVDEMLEGNDVVLSGPALDIMITALVAIRSINSSYKIPKPKKPAETPLDRYKQSAQIMQRVLKDLEKYTKGRKGKANLQALADQYRKLADKYPELKKLIATNTNNRKVMVAAHRFLKDRLQVSKKGAVLLKEGPIFLNEVLGRPDIVGESQERASRLLEIHDRARNLYHILQLDQSGYSRVDIEPDLNALHRADKKLTPSELTLRTTQLISEYYSSVDLHATQSPSEYSIDEYAKQAAFIEALLANIAARDLKREPLRKFADLLKIKYKKDAHDSSILGELRVRIDIARGEMLFNLRKNGFASRRAEVFVRAFADKPFAGDQSGVVKATAQRLLKLEAERLAGRKTKLAVIHQIPGERVIVHIPSGTDVLNVASRLTMDTSLQQQISEAVVKAKGDGSKIASIYLNPTKNGKLTIVIGETVAYEPTKKRGRENHTLNNETRITVSAPSIRQTDYSGIREAQRKAKLIAESQKPPMQRGRRSKPATQPETEVFPETPETDAERAQQRADSAIQLPLGQPEQNQTLDLQSTQTPQLEAWLIEAFNLNDWTHFRDFAEVLLGRDDVSEEKKLQLRDTLARMKADGVI